LLHGGDERLPQLAQRELIFSAYVIGMELCLCELMHLFWQGYWCCEVGCVFWQGYWCSAVFPGRESGCMEQFTQEAVEVDPRV